MDEQYGPPVTASDFLKWFCAVLIGLDACLRPRKRSQRPPRASVVSASKYARIIAGDVESSSLLPLLLLLLLLLLLPPLLLLLVLLGVCLFSPYSCEIIREKMYEYAKMDAAVISRAVPGNLPR